MSNLALALETEQYSESDPLTELVDYVTPLTTKPGQSNIANFWDSRRLYAQMLETLKIEPCDVITVIEKTISLLSLNNIDYKAIDIINSDGYFLDVIVMIDTSVSLSKLSVLSNQLVEVLIADDIPDRIVSRFSFANERKSPQIKPT